MNLAQVTVVLLCYDEAPNIARTLSRLARFPTVIVLDSGSTDGTRELAAGFPNVRVHERPFDDYERQWNHALDLAQTDWVLSLDADYLLEEAFVDELQEVEPALQVAYYARFRYCVNGEPLGASLLPPRAVLFRRAKARYRLDGHTQRLQHDGPSATLRGYILHDDRKPLARWLRNQQRYATEEADKLAHAPDAGLGANDRIRRWRWLAPVLVFVYVLVAKRAILDGWRGWHYAYQRMIAEALLAIGLIESDWRREPGRPPE